MMLVAKEYRYDHAAVHSREYGFPGGEKALSAPGAVRVRGTPRHGVGGVGCRSLVLRAAW